MKLFIQIFTPLALTLVEHVVGYASEETHKIRQLTAVMLWP